MRLFLIAMLLLCISNIYAQNVTLKGKVLGSNSQQAVEFANVFIKGSPKITYSKKDGAFELSGLPLGEVELCISCIGYHSYQHKILLKDGINNCDITLEPSTEELSPIVVTGTGTRYRIDDTPVQTEIISEKSIQELSAKSVEEVISALSSSLDYTLSSMGASIKVNGLGSDYVLILVNGKRLTGSVGGIVDLSRINTEDIKQVEIVKGASSTLYGSDAIAGVINIITKKPRQKISVSNNTRVGAYAEWKQLNTFSYNKGKFSGKTTFSRKQNNGYQLNDMKYNSKWESNHDLPYLVRTYDMPVNKKQSYTITQNLGYGFNPKLQMDAELSWYEKTLYFPFKGRMHNYYYNNKGASVGGNYTINKTDYLDFSVEYGNYKYYKEFPWKYNERYITPDGVSQVTYYPGDRFKNTDETNLITQFKGVFKLNEKNTMIVGTEFIYNNLEAKYRLVNNEASVYTLSLYAQDEFKISEKMDLVGGVRVIHHEKFGIIATPKLSLMYKTGKFVHRATYACGFKSPTLKELYYFYESERMGVRTLYRGNDDLRPQKSNYHNVSTEFKTKKFKTSFGLYINELKDMIDYLLVPTEFSHRQKGVEETKLRYNIHEAQTAGFDWTFDLKILHGLSVGGGYSYVDAKNKTLDIRLNGISEHSATAKVSYLKSWRNYVLNMNLTGNYKSDKFYLEEDKEKDYADPYQLWKLTTSHTIKKWNYTNVVFIAGIDNIFDYVDDRPYGSHYGTLNPGRTLFAGLNIKFTKDNSNNK